MKAKEKLASIVAVSTLLVLPACDADGDGYDDETGEPIPVTAYYAWAGADNGVLVTSGGSRVSYQDENGTRSESLSPGDDAYMKVSGEGKVTCSISVSGEVNRQEGNGTVKCIVVRYDIHN